MADFQIVIPESGCWEFQGSIAPNGYGHINRGGETYAHRYVYAKANGPIPKGMDVCHSCDNRKCIRPDHLFLGTRSDNMQDAKRKGRLSPPPLATTASGRKAAPKVWETRRLRYGPTGRPS